MGAEKAFVYGIRAFFGCGIAYLVIQMVTDPMFEMLRAAGGQAAQVAGWVGTAMSYYAIFYIVVIVISIFVGAYKNEDASQGFVR